jgi:cholest-4-en-3-one 26-monooxygenase
MAIILQMVGVPAERQSQLNDWVFRLLATQDDEFSCSDAERAEIARQFMGYGHALAEERRRSPKDDLLSLLMVAEVDGQRLTYEEFGIFFLLLLAAGTDTPRLLIASGVHTLIEHPEQRARLVAEPSLLPGAVEELLRYCPPLMHFRRTAARDVDVRGVRIRAGQKVVAWNVSANRDDEVFAKPHVFDVERAPNGHVSFGHGPHFCIGNALARMTATIAIGEIISRFPDIEIDGPVERLQSNWFNGPKRMPVALGRRR